MESAKAGTLAVDAYIATFPAEVQAALEAVRATIRAAAPEAEEKIGYGMPTFTLHGNLAHFAAWKGHIGFYPTGSGIAAFADELAPYASAKGSVRFPLGQPLPLDLIDRIVRQRVADNQARVSARVGRKGSP